MDKNCPTRAMRSTLKSNASGPRRTFGFKIEPTATDVENDNSIEVFARLPIGTITFGEATLADLRVPREFSDHLNESVLD
jgi:hypothetical protein